MMMKTSMPKPELNETPSAYADRLGMWYSSTVSLAHKKVFGQYLTSMPVATYMAGLLEIEKEAVWLLDPGAGSGILTCSVGEQIASRAIKPTYLHVVAHETDSSLADALRASLVYLGGWLSSRGISLEAVVRTDDFIMAHCEALSDALGDNPNLFEAGVEAERFDIVISNPPYFKIPKSDPRAEAASQVIHGQPNIYALFMAVSASILNVGGQLIFITPRSYTSGPYFRLFRERFFAKMRPESVHVFESRTDAFKRDEILQENIILSARRDDGWTTTGKHSSVWISSSNGSSELVRSRRRKVRSDLILDMSGFDKVLHVPTTRRELAVMETVRSWSSSLEKLGLAISTGPVVPFRAAPLLDEDGDVPGSHAPLLWMQHVKAMRVLWPIAGIRKPQFIKVTDEAMKLLVPNRNYVLIRRFSAKEEKRRLVAAPYLSDGLQSPWLGLENHLNYLYRPEGELSEVEAWGLSVLYNCSMLDTYFRTLNGNTQVSATELRGMPVPDRQAIIDLGAMAMALSASLEMADDLVATVLGERSDAKPPQKLPGVQDALAQEVREAATGG